MRDLIRSIRRRASYLLWPARKDTAGLPPVAYQPLREARTFYLSRECALIGQAGPTLTATQRGTIRAVFDARVASWLRVEYPRPAQAQIFAAEAVSSPALSLAVVMPNYINNDPAFIDHDFAYHVARSAQDAGFAVSGFAADAITYGGTDDLAAELKRLDLFFASTRPDIVAIDGNYIPGGRALDAAALEGLKARLGFKVVAFVGDCNDLQPDYLGYWTRVADLSVIFHKDTRHYRNLSDKSTVLVCPALPFHEGTFVAAPQRDIDLSYMGSDSRHRRFFLDAAQSAGIDTFCRFHDRRRITAPSLEEFASVLGRSKLSFNNGWMDTGPAIITGRVAEVILAGAVLLQEVGTAIDDYLVPFVHYVPVANIHQFVAFSQFLLEENELRAQIAQDARRYWIEHYSSARFWRHVHRALFPEAAVAR